MSSFVNFTNHPSEKWDDNQIRAAKEFGGIVDISFPDVPPELKHDEISKMADSCVTEILRHEPSAVLCQGEFTLCFAVVEKLKAEEIPVFAACTKRIVEEKGDSKIVKFMFEGFRRY